MHTIHEFQGEFRFLSNFWPAEVELGGLKFPTVEHAYQAAKTLDIAQRRQIQSLLTPGQAKRMGRAVTMRSDWESIKLDIMIDLVWQKFSRHPELKALLLSTGNAALEEGNAWGDRFWGISPVGSGIGKNMLGKILMAVREQLHEEMPVHPVHTVNYA